MNRVAEADGHSRTFTLFCRSQSQVDSAFGSPSRQNVQLHEQLPGWWVKIFLQYLLCCLRPAISFNPVSCGLCGTHIPKHHRSTAVLHSRNASIISLVDFLSVAKKLHFGLISPTSRDVELLSLEVGHLRDLHSNNFLLPLHFSFFFSRDSFIPAEVICGFFYPGSCCWSFCWSTWLWFGFNRIPHFPLLKVWMLPLTILSLSPGLRNVNSEHFWNAVIPRITTVCKYLITVILVVSVIFISKE